MSKLRKSILIIGILVIVVAASLATALALYATGSIKTDPIELVYSVKDIQKVYDGAPLKANEYRLTSGELVAGHTAQVEFLGEQTNVGVSRSDLQVKIYDNEGYNVSSSYVIRVETGELAVTPKPVSVEMPSQKVVYNGSKVSFTTYNIAEDSGDLVSGHILAGSTDVGLMNVGERLPEDLQPRVYDKAGNDVTANYDLTVSAIGDIEIIKRPVSVRPVSYEKVYDGTALISAEIEYVDGTLADGQYARFVINNGYDDRLTAVDEISTRVTEFKVYDKVNGSEVEVTKNYDIDTFETGSLKVTPRPLTIVAKSEEWVYDGFEHSFIDDGEAEYIEGLAPTDSITAVYYTGSIKDVGTRTNAINGYEVTCNPDNYDVTVINGTLTVTRFPLHVVTGNGEKYYDGSSLSNSALYVTLANERHSIAIKDGADYPRQINAGSIVNEFEVAIKDDGADVTANYEITYEYGTLTVNKMPVTVTLSSKETVTYDGEPKQPNLNLENNFSIKAIDDAATENLALGPEHFTVALHTKSVVDVGTYSYSVNFKDKSTSDNYVLEVSNYGYITVLPREITVTTNTAKRDYDGTPLTDGGCSVTSSVTLVGGHKLAAPATLPSITDSGKIKNVFAVTVNDKDGAPVTQNYKITYVYGDLEITACTLAVKLKDYNGTAGFSYSGKPVTLNVQDAITNIVPTKLFESKVIEKSDFVIDYCDTKGYTAVGSYIYKVKIADKKLASDFIVSITGENGTVEVTKAAVTVKIKDVTRTYSGDPVFLDGPAVIHSISDSSGTLSREDFEVTFGADLPTNVNSYRFNVVLDTKKAVNYTVNVENIKVAANKYATLTIAPFAVTVNTPSLSAVYNGEEQTATSFTHTPLASAKHNITVDEDKYVASVTDVAEGKVENKFAVIIKQGNTDLTGNYDIKYFYGTLEVKPFAITIKTASHEKVYDGAELYDGTYEDVVLANDAHSIVLPEYLPAITDVGSVTNEFEITIMLEDGDHLEGDVDVTANYEITYVYGTLKIAPRKVRVITPDESKYYDGLPLEHDETNYHTQAAFIVITSDDPAFTDAFDPENYKIELNDAVAFSAITNAGSADNVYEIIITSVTDEAIVTNNFEITYVYGKLTVKPRTVVVTFESDIACDYTGEEIVLTSEDVIKSVADSEGNEISDGSETGTLNGSHFTAVFNAPLLDAGGYSFTVKFKEGVNTSNYVFNSPVGFVRVNPLKVKVSFGDGDENGVHAKETYDGTAKKLRATDVIEEITDEDGMEIDGALLTPADFEVYGADGDMCNAGTYFFNVRIADTNKAKNFVLTGGDGKLEITALTVNVQLEDLTFTYDGNDHRVGAEALTSGNRLLSASDFRLVFKQDNAEVDKVIDAGTYTYAPEFRDADFGNNFAIGEPEGTIKIEKLAVTVTLKNYERTYDGEAFEIVFEDAVTLSTNLLKTSDFELVDTDEMINAGTHTYSVGLKDVEGAENFTVPEKTSATVKINPLAVTVTLKSTGKTYDGLEYVLSAADVHSIDSNLLTAADLDIEYTDGSTGQTNAGEYGFKVILKDDVADNFRLSQSNGTVTIAKRAVTVYTADFTCVYNTLENSDTALTMKGHVPGHSVTAAAGGTTLKNVGSVVNKQTCEISDGTTDVTDNYVITYVYGTLTVTPLPVTVTTDDGEFTYDGTAHTVKTADSGALLGANISIADGYNYPSITEVGTVKNEYPFQIYTEKGDGSKTDVTENYKINAVYGTITVVPRKVKVTFKSDTKKVYRGSPVTLTAAEAFAAVSPVVESGEVAGTIGALVTADDLTIVYNKAVKDVDLYSFTAKFKSDTKAKNFELELQNTGYVQVTKAELKVTLAKATAEYNGKVQVIDVSGLTVDAATNYDELTAADFRPVCQLEVKNADKYAYTVEITDANIAKNYKLNVITTGAEFEITPVTVTVTLKDFEVAYGGTAYIPSVADAILKIEGDGAKFVRKNDFVIVFDEDEDGNELRAIAPDDYGYTVEIADATASGNFEVEIAAGGNVTVNACRIEAYLEDVMISRAEFEGSGEYNGLYEVNSNVKIAQYTPLANGHRLVVKTASAVGNPGDHTVEIFAIEMYITDADGNVLGYFADGISDAEKTTEAEENNLGYYEFTNASVSEFVAPLNPLG